MDLSPAPTERRKSGSRVPRGSPGPPACCSNAHAWSGGPVLHERRPNRSMGRQVRKDRPEPGTFSAEAPGSDPGEAAAFRKERSHVAGS
jgi:hypothetical protein